jgi:hypothetical protein
MPFRQVSFSFTTLPPTSPPVEAFSPRQIKFDNFGHTIT